MTTAAQAREQTKERITQIAKEFIINEVEGAIQEAISFGRFHCTVNLKGLANPKAAGAEIVSQLQDLKVKVAVVYGRLKESEGEY